MRLPKINYVTILQRLRKPENLLLLGILFVALALRLWGIGFGLPHRYHIDEPPQVIAALRIAQGDFKIDYPPLSPNIHQMLLTSLFGVLFVIQFVTGYVSSPMAFALQYLEDPTPFYLLTRGLSVTSSIFALLILYWLVNRLRGRRVALVATALMAFCFLDVREAHFGKQYSLLSFLVMLSIALIWLGIEKGKSKYILASGFVSGVAIGLRYSTLPLGLALLVAYLFIMLRKKSQVSKVNIAGGFFLLGLIGLVGVIVGAPALVLNPGTISSTSGVWASYVVESAGFEGFRFVGSSAISYYALALQVAWGVPLLLMAPGALMIAKHWRREALLLFVFPGVYSFIILLAPPESAVFVRYLMPVLPFLALIAAEGFIWLVDYLPATMSARYKTITSLLFLGLLLSIPLAQSLRFDWLLAQTDTRTQAKIWIESHVPSGARIAQQWHGPPLSTPDDPEPRSERVFDVTVLNPFSSDPSLYNLEYYREEGYQYLILSSFIYNLGRVDPVEDRTRNMFYNNLQNDAELVAEFKPYEGEGPRFIVEQLWGPFTDLWNLERPGPVIRIYRLTP